MTECGDVDFEAGSIAADALSDGDLFPLPLSPTVLFFAGSVLGRSDTFHLI